MAKKWYSLNDVFDSNTQQENIRELYVDGTTAKYTKRLNELNVLIAQEEAEKRARREKREKQK